MNPTDAIKFLTQQADFAAARAVEPGNSVAQIHAYATRADIYYTLASFFAILYDTPAAFAPRGLGNLGDADDKARDLSC